jgi:ketosteroid isomerase-like protein
MGVEQTTAMTEERLAEFGEAWNTHDPDLVVSYFAEGGAYHASFGPELLGRTFAGRDAVREGVAAFFAAYPDGRFSDATAVVCGDRGFSEWTFSATGPDGEPFSVRGCDLFVFDGDAIAVKNAFRKLRA